MKKQPAVFEAIDVSRSYPGVRALRSVNLTLHPGEVTALMGENGAGKSTLIRLIGGLEQPTSGELRIRGEKVELGSAADSQAAGISVVAQEFRLVPQLTVAENIFLGNELTRGGLIRVRETKRRARKLLEQLGLDLDPSRTVETLSVGDQQMVEITRTLSRDAEIIVMDEPSAALNRREVRRLLDLIERLKAQGKAILYVSHRLDEIFEISDNIVVFRDGERVGELRTADTDEPELVELMLGRELQAFEQEPVVAGTEDQPVRFSVRDVSCPKVVEPVNFDVRRGEIVGVAGLVGSGRSEIMQALFGAIPSKGEVRLDDQVVDLRGPTGALKAGIFMLGENRKAEGILPHLSVLENLLISAKNEGEGVVSRAVPRSRRDLATYERLKQELRIKVDSPRQYIGNLSGGNQQKVLFGRAILSGCTVLLLNEPTRGVDVGAKVEIYQLIQRLAEAGVAVVVSSSDTPELVSLVRRCLVLRNGHVVATLTDDDVTEDRILAESVGSASTISAGKDRS
ncbi:sugar ABC transporter ATP-binding protein [Aeromicrobium sp. CFBP 8757]|uniref:sugar ABC transporter ATP-binding protein n=1 Tax=Aeromicrobium sp. CFBP 8757 TaxID=2775288 RepID=UPI00177E7953|nr:sugar ABC transporter ATP-binding protein [Aeromicrobium sp. CFBP 8757]MBD8605393.1 sugar ABC transporter ATP-binding protein [Aeromicrobium sp. CFBP 8757]